MQGKASAFQEVRILSKWVDRLGRSLLHLITTMTNLEERGIGFKNLFTIYEIY
jgi:DNA invertase Pin-like site-specific DNA recombinase